MSEHGNDTRIDDLKSQLEESGFEPTTRGALADDLHVANQILNATWPQYKQEWRAL